MRGAAAETAPSRTACCCRLRTPLLEQGDELLFAGSRRARGWSFTLRNEHALDYVLSGREPGGWLWDKLSRP